MKNDMSLQLANTIRMDWGKFLETTNGSLMLIFANSIPQSLLPYPKESIKSALYVIIKQLSSIGDQEGIKICKMTLPYLDHYTNDENALKIASERLNDKKFLSLILPRMPETQMQQLEYMRQETLKG